MKLYIVVNTIASTLRESFVMLQEAYWTVSYTRSVVLSSCRPQHRARSSRQANGLPYSLSPMLQILSLNIRLAWFNYDRINFSVQDVHFGLAYLERLPKSLQKVTFHVDEQVFCRFYRRKTSILQTFVSDPGALSMESMICSAHGLEAEPCSITSGHQFMWILTVTAAAYGQANNFEIQ
jgi:hypothetical protein